MTSQDVVIIVSILFVLSVGGLYIFGRKKDPCPGVPMFNELQPMVQQMILAQGGCNGNSR